MSYQKQSLGVLYKKIQESRVLLVGAGGIGCELLKNLVLTGFGEIHIIDLDTIDLSNLNRQFLFRHEHIKKPKATVAKEVAQRFNPNVELVAYHANIKDAKFDVEWFSTFAIVFNALDNLEARRHVNRMCLAADVPLIESGTTGFNGQVQVIRKGRTACYDCNPKTTPKSFPVCTIRSTPSQPIHCIVWAKSYLLPELFGVSEEEGSELNTTTDAENAEEIAKLKEEAEALKKIRGLMGTEHFAKEVFEKVFNIDIQRLADMEDMWKTRKAPTPLAFDDLTVEGASINPNIASSDQQPWTVAESLTVFKDSLQRLSTRISLENQKGPSETIITFDKDDEDTLDFVTAASNLRSSIFQIASKSKFDVKQMAGNIIPAIATTNAMIGSLCVMQAFKVMRGEYGRTKFIFLDRGNISAGAFDPPNPDCAVCSVAIARIKVDIETATLDHLVNDVLKNDLGYGEEIAVMNEKGGIVFDPDMEDNLVKKLKDLEIIEGGLIIVKDDEDEHDAPRVDLHLIVEHAKQLRIDESSDQSNGDEVKPIILISQDEENKLEIPRKPRKASQVGINGDSAATEHAEESNGDVAVNTQTANKRKRELDGLEEVDTPVKKIQQQKLVSTSGGGEVPVADNTIVLDEEEGAIEIE